MADKKEIAHSLQPGASHRHQAVIRLAEDG
jgi:hypothetical protein